MINVQTKIHDKFSVEFKMSFEGSSAPQRANFDVNTWIFIPNSLDINRATYDKTQFYRDMKSNVRLITPDFTLDQIVGEGAIPYQNLKNALEQVKSNAPGADSELEFQLKLFGAIFKSADRDNSKSLSDRADDELIYELCAVYVDKIREILTAYRGLMASAEEIHKSSFEFVDEFMSHQVEIRALKIIKAIDEQIQTADKSVLHSARELLIQMLHEERNYKVSRNYSHSVVDDSSHNRELLYRHSMLKKYVESVLYLRVNTKEDGKAVRQMSFGLAAGFAMILSTLVALPFQRHLGNYPSLIFIILVLAYMLKDRVKDLTRNIFAYRLKNRYFDTKTVISIQDKEIGWIKEGMDFISDDKVPEEVIRLRDRSNLEADNTLFEEKIILYRKKVFVDNEELHAHNDYDFTGINDIMRFHIQTMTSKMDNPSTSIDCLDEKGLLRKTEAERVYTLYFVMQFRYDDQSEYKIVKVVANRDGILSL